MSSRGDMSADAFWAQIPVLAIVAIAALAAVFCHWAAALNAQTRELLGRIEERLAAPHGSAWQREVSTGESGAEPMDVAVHTELRLRRVERALTELTQRLNAYDGLAQELSALRGELRARQRPSSTSGRPDSSSPVVGRRPESPRPPARQGPESERSGQRSEASAPPAAAVPKTPERRAAPGADVLAARAAELARQLSPHQWRIIEHLARAPSNGLVQERLCQEADCSHADIFNLNYEGLVGTQRVADDSATAVYLSKLGQVVARRLWPHGSPAASPPPAPAAAGPQPRGSPESTLLRVVPG